MKRCKHIVVMERLLNLWTQSKQKLFVRTRPVTVRTPLLVVETKQQQQIQPRRNKFQVFLTSCCDCIHQFIPIGQKVKEERIEEIEDPCMNLTLIPLFGLEMDMMKDRFAMLLLGEDLSGGGKGVSSALALSNALTNLAASVFGEQWKLEPMSQKRKARWKREIGWLVSVTDHIVEFVASQQQGKDGSIIEIMVTHQRKDLLTNIPALRNLDVVLLGTLDKFKEQEYQYVSCSKKGIKRGDKAIKVPPNGLSQESRLFLHIQKDAVEQVLKESMAINAHILSQIEVPESYMETLPKNGKSTLGDSLYKSITGDAFDPEQFMTTLNLSSEHQVIDLKNKIEASIEIWKRKMMIKKDGKASWVQAVSSVKRGIFEERAETILLLLRHQFPGLPQSSLDTTKIQYNRDVGRAIVESYSRALENLATKMMSDIEDVLHADSIAREAGAKTSNTLICAIKAPIFDFMGWGYQPAQTQVK